MTGLVRRATLITAAGLLAATAVMAGVPSATTSTQPGAIRLVAQAGGVADPVQAVTYTIKDAATNPVPGSVVIMNFAGCTDSKISNAQFGAGMTTNCPGQSVTGVTNASGVIVFTVVGAGEGVFMTSKCVTVTADGVPMNPLAGATADYNALGGVDGLDGSIWRGIDLSPGSTATSTGFCP
jgi:hypothetical protein